MSLKFLTYANRVLISIGLRGFAEMAAVAMAVTGVATYVYDRIETRDLQKKTTSLKYMEEYRTGEVAKAKRELLILWVDQKDSFAFARTRSSEANKNKYIRDVINSGRQYRNDVIDITTFFDEVSSCVESDICDKPVITKTLLPDITKHFELYAPIICEIHERSRVYELGAITTRVFFSDVDSITCNQSGNNISYSP